LYRPEKLDFQILIAAKNEKLDMAFCLTPDKQVDRPIQWSSEDIHSQLSRCLGLRDGDLRHHLSAIEGNPRISLDPARRP